MLHLPRVRLQRAVSVAEGLWASSPESRLGREWAAAVAADEGEVEGIHYRGQAERHDARVRQKLGFPRSGGG